MKIDRFEQFRALHHQDGAFIMPNAWDAGTARILSALGFAAIATTSAGYAFATGRRDSTAALTRTEILDNASAILDATPLPVSADLEDGFGTSPEACAETIRQAIACGLQGGSIEDATGDASAPIHDIGLATERIAAAAEAARGQPFLLTARAENHINGVHDLKDTIRRLQAFSEAGADVLYAPGLPDLDAIRTMCRAVDKPVNVVMGLSGQAYTVDELSKAGVKRISTGGSLARAALGALIRAGEEMRDHGTFTYSDAAVPDRVVSAMMSDKKAQLRG
ncbi:MAG: isocitrate lyase/phosphoenolpyruvate mutase family protein [Albidovulum sp.]